MKELLIKFYDFQDKLFWGKDVDDLDKRVDDFLIGEELVHIVTYILEENGELKDYFEVFRDGEDGARVFYGHILHRDDLYSASISVVIESTDY